jgi:signal peptidase I
MRSAIREVIETIVLAVFIVAVLQLSVQNFRVSGPSMAPVLANEDRVLVSKVVFTEIEASRLARFVPGWDVDDNDVWHPFGAPKRGDVLVFKWPLHQSQNFVKRVIGMPGDEIRIDDGQVLVNNVPQDESYVTHPSDETLLAHVVAEDSYYVMGDNRARSDDSRHWGDVHKELIIGKVWAAYWPLDRVSTP